MKRKAKGVSEVLEKDPGGSKILETNVFVSNSEIKAEKEQPDHEFKSQHSTLNSFINLGFPPPTFIFTSRIDLIDDVEIL